MRPTTISASSLANAQDCMAKFEAVNIRFIPEIGKKLPARVGTAFHYVAEHLVRDVYITKTRKWTLEYALDLWEEAYLVTFGTADTGHEEYDDGRELVIKWFERTDLSAYTILSTEEKRRIPVPSAAYDKSKPAHVQPNAAIVKMSYIWDLCYIRIDPVTGEKLIVIRDYKTIRKLPRPEDLHEKLQMRIYALAAFVYFKDQKPDKIRVELDLIRGDGCTGVTYTSAEIVKFWTDLRKELQRILDVNEIRKEHYTMGPGCRYCPIAATCVARGKNVDGGGLLSLTFDQQLELRAKIQAQNESNAALLADVDAQIAAEAVALDLLEFDVGNYRIDITLGKRRTLDQERLKIVLGAQTYTELAPITMAKYDQMMKPDSGVTDEQREKLPECVVTKLNKNPSIAVDSTNTTGV